MKRSQLNISIKPELLKKIKESARKSGKSITHYVSDCCASKVENFPTKSIDSRFITVEKRLQSIKKIFHYYCLVIKKDISRSS